MVTAAGVAFQGVGVVLLQLIVQPSPADERFALFLGILPFHLPKEKSPETRPEMEALAVVVAQHSGVSKKPVQPFAGTGIAADHPRHFQVKTFKGGQLQQEAPHRQVKAPVDSGLKVEEHLVEHPRHQLRRPRLVRGHAPRRDGHTQRIAQGFFQNSVDLVICYICSRKLKQSPHIVRVKKAGRRPPAPSSALCTETPSGSPAAHRAKAGRNGAPDLSESVRKEPAARLPPA